MPELTLGIDLGASYCSAAVCTSRGVHFVLDDRGEACMPSAVYLPAKGPPVIGAKASTMRAHAPANVIYGFKRLLGQKWESDARRFVDATSAYRLEKGSGDRIEIVTGTNRSSPVEIAALVLRHLRTQAELRFGGRIRSAVVTVPVTAPPQAKKDTTKAAKIAGFTKIKLLYEPCASACSLGLGETNEKRTFLVYDFGGGTFDATVVAQLRNSFHVLSAGGDPSLGGDNFDESMARMMANRIWNTTKIDVTKDATLWAQLNYQCELAKRALTGNLETRLRLDNSNLLSDRFADVLLVVNRPDVENCWSTLVERSMKESAKTVVAANCRPQDLSGVLLTGGTTHVPLVQARVKQVFPRPITNGQDPQTLVAFGAALYGMNSVELKDAA